MESRQPPAELPTGFRLPGQRDEFSASRGGHIEATIVRDLLEGAGVAVAYQPIVDVPTRRIHGWEALVRASHPELGEVSPLLLVEAATRHQLIDDLTIQVAEQALATIGTAAALVGEPLRLTINLELEQLRADCRVIEWLLARRLPEGVVLLLEITERGPDEWAEDNEEAARLLLDAGIEMGLDDYGAGAARLGFLQHRDWQLVKMDRKFLLFDTPRDRILLEHFTRMLHELDIPILAEGIETEAHLKTAAELGVEFAQGFWLGRPIPGDDLLRQLERQGLQLPPAS